jgi:hypothetical protein
VKKPYPVATYSEGGVALAIEVFLFTGSLAEFFETSLNWKSIGNIIEFN